MLKSSERFAISDEFETQHQVALDEISDLQTTVDGLVASVQQKIDDAQDILDTFNQDGLNIPSGGATIVGDSSIDGSLALQDHPLVGASLQDVSIKTIAHGALGAAAIFDMEQASWHDGTVDADTVLTFANPSPAGEGCILYLSLTNGGAHVVTWPATVAWDEGTPPTLQAAATDLLGFSTTDGGATWRGFAIWSGT